MTLEFYKILHLAGLICLFFGFGGLLVASYSGVTLRPPARIMSFATHGIGLLFLLVGGFGMLAKMGIMANMPGWVVAKIIIWMLMGVGISLVKRKGHIGWPVAILLLVLGTTAAVLGINKPF
ncbi:hypothetical protein [Bdellovibrio svalbardensis]|uniref:Invasion protein n=1 Tax=Bdellovibrio svalbardensis TaxID=2972972 RepID=A0ABT6DMD1_9BACT|nr:hypothetical protein [Bdellovibrio svalbardensis]MDG0818040.1 hypothetical protein [Bdellovibrio svalbardensis]